MLTPVEMQNRTLKSGRGYKKNEMDEFLEEVFQNYEQLYKENLELKDKLSVLSDGLQYYKDLEKTLQKTLVVAEKAAEETRTASISKANSIEQKAKAQARYIIEDAKKQAEKIHNQTVALLQQYENYRSQYKQLVAAQLELMESDAFHLHLNNIAETPDFLKEKDETEEYEKVKIKTKKEPAIKRVPFLNEEKKIAAKKEERTEEPKKMMEAPTEKEEEREKIVESPSEETVSIVIEEAEETELNISGKDIISEISNELQKEDEPDKKKTIVKAELKKELKRPDRLKVNRPEQLSATKDIAKINSIINKELSQVNNKSKKDTIDDEDDTFEFL